MNLKVIWSPRAEEDYVENIDYLLDEWTLGVAIDFANETDRVLKIIAESPKAFQRHKKMKCHIVPITKHITLYYDVKRKEIELIRFWNNYKNPRNKKRK